MSLDDPNIKKFSTVVPGKSDTKLVPLPTLASVEALSIPLVQEVVFLADFRCVRCQKRIAHIISRMNGETESVEVNVLEKKVTLTCRYPQANVVCRPLNKSTMITRLFRSSCLIADHKNKKQ